MNFRSIRVRLLGMMILITVGFTVYLTRDIARNYFALQESGRLVAVSEVAVAGSALVHEPRGATRSAAVSINEGDFERY